VGCLVTERHAWLRLASLSRLECFVNVIHIRPLYLTCDHSWSRLSRMVTFRHPYLLLDELFHCQVVFGFYLHVFTLCFVESSHALSRTVTSNQPLSRVITNGHFWPFFSLLSLLLMFHHTWSHFITVGHALSRTVTLRNHSLLTVTLVQCQIAFFFLFSFCHSCHV
jgi:hypothetical protein